MDEIFGKIILILLLVFCMEGCLNSENNINNLVKRSISIKEIKYSSTFSEKLGLFNAYKSWEGTPYLWGGESRLGIDCSAFMQRLFEEVYDIKIPRTTIEQMKEGKNPGYVNRQIGDLIFFQTGPETFHVGMYYQNDTFFHSSSTFGVTTGNLNDEFWKKTYLKIRRFKE